MAHTHVTTHICQTKELHTVQINPSEFNLIEKCFNLAAIFVQHQQKCVTNNKHNTDTFITNTPTQKTDVSMKKGKHRKKI